jgi:hypothetical protein
MGIKFPEKFRISIVACIIASTILATTYLNGSEFSAFCQTEVDFTPSTEFFIPANNGSISFAVNGTYELAYLENGFWNFLNLRLSNTVMDGTVNLKVSAKDSSIRITSCQIYNSTFAGSKVMNARLRYAVSGNGKQSFNLGLASDGGDWSVIVNGEFIGKNRGWSLLPDGTLTVTNIVENVTLAYYGFPISYVESENGSTQSFLNEHSVAITTIVVGAITSVVAITIYTKNKKRME